MDGPGNEGNGIIVEKRWKRTGNRMLLFALTGFLAFLGLSLGWDLVRARQDTEQYYREWKDSNQELERLLEANRLLEKELQALQNDPVYIESVLRQWRMAHPGETVLVGEP